MFFSNRFLCFEFCFCRRRFRNQISLWAVEGFPFIGVSVRNCIKFVYSHLAVGVKMSMELEGSLGSIHAVVVVIVEFMIIDCGVFLISFSIVQWDTLLGYCDGELDFVL